ncbi:MAG: hypothetical protein MI861_09315 [Pirellulales bacterium]|nr:hypothetical protein [Pirellulales bacterium]
MQKWILIASVLLMPAGGCTSFSAVHLHRSESNTSWQKKRALHGIPVTLKVPTHLKLDVVENHVLLLDDSQKLVQRTQAPVALRRVDTSFIETEKIFLVDIKRPGAGELDTTIDLDPESQYFKQIKETLTDETITQVGNLVQAIAPSGLFGVPTTEDETPSELAKVKLVSNVVASQIFEVDAPDFEIQLMAFLNRHVNCCHDCGVLAGDHQRPQFLPDIHQAEPTPQEQTSTGVHEIIIGDRQPEVVSIIDETSASQID